MFYKFLVVFGLSLCFCGENKGRGVWLVSVAQMASGVGHALQVGWALRLCS